MHYLRGGLFVEIYQRSGELRSWARVCEQLVRARMRAWRAAGSPGCGLRLLPTPMLAAFLGFLLLLWRPGNLPSMCEKSPVAGFSV